MMQINRLFAFNERKLTRFTVFSLLLLLILLIQFAASSDDDDFYYGYSEIDRISFRSIRHRRSEDPQTLLLGYLAGSIVNTGGVGGIINTGGGNGTTTHRSDAVSMGISFNTTYEFFGKIHGTTGNYDRNSVDGLSLQPLITPTVPLSMGTPLSYSPFPDRINSPNISSKVELAKQLLESNYATLSSQLMGKQRDMYI